MRYQAIVGVTAALLAGCVGIELPTTAHLHVGHVVTAWRDTPGGRGLIEVALADAAVASEHAAYAVEGAREIGAVRLHLGHVLHAVDPGRATSGPGSGYGLARAIADAADHLGFANEARDATANLRSGLPAIEDRLRRLQREARAVAALIADALGSGDPAQALAYAQEVQQRCEGVQTRLREADQQVAALLAGEQPPYRPVARRHLFGIFPLSSGESVHYPRAAPGYR